MDLPVTKFVGFHHVTILLHTHLHYILKAKWLLGINIRLMGLLLHTFRLELDRHENFLFKHRVSVFMITIRVIG